MTNSTNIHDITPSQCRRCVMDTTARNITFDEEGVCNFCSEFIDRHQNVIHQTPEQKREKLNQLIEKIKKQGNGKPYDCIIGVSGGVDSSWVLVRAVELGLRPLAVHMDNGWNSELAQNNISNLVNKLGVDLYTHVINWNEYKKLMQCFFDSDVVDVELLYDNAMLAVNWHQARKKNIKYILAGTNLATEGMPMPKNWNWFKYDKKNIKNIAGKFGNIKLNTFPSIGVLGLFYARLVKRIKWVSILDFMEFNKFDVMEELAKNYGYKPYPYKHYESIFTRFYQGHILTGKFGVDKRLLHFSTLIISGQMSRKDAMRDLESIPYPSRENLEDDTRYFLKKMEWAPKDLENYIKRSPKCHSLYGSELKRYTFLTEKLRNFIPQSLLKKVI